MIGSSLSGKAVKVYRFDSEKYGTVMVRPLRKDYIIFFVADYICQFSDGQYHFFCKTYNKNAPKRLMKSSNYARILRRSSFLN